MDTNDTIQFSKVLEDRINIIEDSYTNSFLDNPISLLQGRLADETEDLGIEYLLNYQTTRLGTAINIGIFSSQFYPEINNSEKYKEVIDAIPLKYNDESSPLSEILNKRRSVRKYSGKSMPYKTLSNILFNAQNMRKVHNFFFKNTPSGGGLYPIDLYIYSNNIEGLDCGIYLLQSISQTLKPVIIGGQKEVKKILLNQTSIDLEKHNATIFFVFDYVKTYQKYGDIALALGLIEVGSIAQTINLLSTSYGIGSCDIGGFDKPYCEKVLGLDGLTKHAVYAIVLGEVQNDKDI